MAEEPDPFPFKRGKEAAKGGIKPLFLFLLLSLISASFWLFFYFSLPQETSLKWAFQPTQKIAIAGRLELSAPLNRQRTLDLNLTLEPKGRAAEGVVYEAAIDYFALYDGSGELLLCFERKSSDQVHYQLGKSHIEELLDAFHIDLSHSEVQADHSLFQKPFSLYLKECGAIGAIEGLDPLKKGLYRPAVLGSWHSFLKAFFEESFLLPPIFSASSGNDNGVWDSCGLFLLPVRLHHRLLADGKWEAALTSESAPYLPHADWLPQVMGHFSGIYQRPEQQFKQIQFTVKERRQKKLLDQQLEEAHEVKGFLYFSYSPVIAKG